MKLENPFFKKNSPILISKIIENIKSKNSFSKKYVNDIREINTAKKNDITFFHSSKYSSVASKTKASFCITNLKLEKFLPKTCTPIVVKNVLLSTAKVTEMFYSNATHDNFDNSVSEISKTIFKKIKYGKNVLIGKNVKLARTLLLVTTQL